MHPESSMDEAFLDKLLFRIGNDTPWETDGIEYVASDDYIIHRGPCEGLYNYMYKGYYVYDCVDAVQLLQWNMARIKGFSLFPSWAGSGIKFPINGAAIRYFADTSADESQRGYLICENQQFYVVNKFYLLAEGLAEVEDDALYKAIDVPNMSYKRDEDPWKEDKLFFLPMGDFTIRKGRVPGRYLLTRKGTTRNVSAAELLADGKAKPVTERRAYYFAQYCPTAATKTALATDELCRQFKAAFAEEDVIFKDTFTFRSLLDVAICYDAMPRNVVPGIMVGQIEFPVAPPEVVTAYRNYTQYIAALTDAAKEESIKIDMVLSNFDSSLQSLQHVWARLRETEEYIHWLNTLSLDSQHNFAIFYERTVKPDEKWDTFLKKVAQVDKAFQSIKAQLPVAVDAARQARERILNAYRTREVPTGGRKRNEQTLRQVRAAFESLPYIQHEDDRLNSLSSMLCTMTNQLGVLQDIYLEQRILKQRAQQYAKLRKTVQSANGGAHRSLAPSHHPFTSAIRMVRHDYRITRMSKHSTADVDAYNWNMNNCYTLDVNGRTEYVFDEVLVYLELAVRK